MCLAIVSFRELDEWPLFLAANRDESYERPSEGPRPYDAGDLRVLAPKDLEAGGTWLGVNGAGLLAVVTNRSDLPQTPSENTPSRGQLVKSVLASTDLDEAVVYVPGHALTGVATKPRDGDNTFEAGGKTFVYAEPVGPAEHPLGTPDPKNKNAGKKGEVRVVPQG